VHILLATDAQWVLDEVVAALGSSSTSFTVVSEGREVAATVATRTPDLVVLDMQIGSMGAMAVAMDLRLDESGGRLPRVPIVVLLDRAADVHLARRCGADAWLVKPLDALGLRRASTSATTGGGPSEPADSLGAR
jgi:CheY-like chemotaxis protein